MISPQELRRNARGRGIAIDLVEKDYVLGWLLFGIAKSSVSDRLAFKGGTALSKVYFPDVWRLSEDLDFTALDETAMPEFGEALMKEVPKILAHSGRMAVELKKVPFTNPRYLQSKFKFTGPIGRGTIKIEVSREPFPGKMVRKQVPQRFDYPKFSVRAYSLDNIAAEKFRALIERGKIRDYYDAWKLLKVARLDRENVKELFFKKCDAKGIRFAGVEQFFPENLSKKLEPYLEVWLTRLSSEKLPPLEEMIGESKQLMNEFFGS